MADVRFDNAFALLVGVGGRDFDITVKDATDIYDILIDPLRAGYAAQNVNLLTEDNATRQAFIDGLDNLIRNTSKSDDATVFIYYSGHGGQYINSGPGNSEPYEYYLQTWGYRIDDPDNTMLNGKIFTAKIEKIKAKRLVILLDCCHAAGMKRSKRLVRKGSDTLSDKLQLSGVKLIELLKGGEGRVFISACADKETSVILPDAENSLFTEVVLEALAGAASGEDPLVRVIDLMYHVLREVPKRIEKYDHAQNPVINEATDLNATYFICQNGKSVQEKTNGVKAIAKKVKGIAEEDKLDYIRKYEHIIKIEAHYNQSVVTHGNVEKQINIGKNTGDIHM